MTTENEIYQLHYSYALRSFGHEHAFTITISRLSVTSDASCTYTQEINNIYAHVIHVSTKQGISTESRTDLRPRKCMQRKKATYANDYFKRLPTQSNIINLYGTFQIIGSKEKITRVFKSLPNLMAKTHRIEQLKTPIFKVWRDRNCKEETPNSWDKLIDLIMDNV